MGAFHNRRHCHRFASIDTQRDPGKFRPGLGINRLNENLENAATGEPNRIRIAIADAIRLVAVAALGDDVIAHLIERTLNAAATHRADGLAAIDNEH